MTSGAQLSIVPGKFLSYGATETHKHFSSYASSHATKVRLLTMSVCVFCDQEDGSLLTPDAVVTFPDGTSGGTCREINTRLSSIESQTLECYEVLQTLDYSCDCLIPAQPCPVCPDENIPGNTSSHQCGQAIVSSKYQPEGSAACTDLQHLAEEHCGCHQEHQAPPTYHDSCNVCADGSDPLHTWQMEDNNNNNNNSVTSTECFDLMAQAHVLPNSSQACFSIQRRAVEACGCKPTTDACSLCEDGSIPSRPNTIVTVNTTCADLDGSVPTFSEWCPWIQRMGHIQCGCPTPPEAEGGPCSLCYEGERFVGNNSFDGSQRTCSNVAFDIFSIPTESDECRQHQAIAALNCGCTSSPPLPENPSCTLCPGGAEPINHLALIPETDNITCGTYNLIAPYLYDSSNCFMEDPTRLLCGCPPPTTCSLCDDDEPVIDLTKMVDFEGGPVSCGELQSAAENIVLGLSVKEFERDCNSFRAQYGACCPRKRTPPPSTIRLVPSPAPTISGASNIHPSINLVVAIPIIWWFLGMNR